MAAPAALPLIAGLTAAAKALLNTPAGRKAVEKGSKAVTRFLKRKDPKAFEPTPAQQAAGRRLQQTMKRKRLVKNIQVGTAAAAAGAAAGIATDEDEYMCEDWRDMKANAIEEERRRKLDRESAGLLNKGGFVKGKANRDGIAIRGKTVGGIY